MGTLLGTSSRKDGVLFASEDGHLVATRVCVSPLLK